MVAAMAENLVMAKARDGSPLALTISECILLDKVREGITHIPQSKFGLIEDALERLGRLSMDPRLPR
jgi:hypothetical protein